MLKFLPVQDVNGRFIGRLLLEDNWKQELKSQEMLLGTVIRKSDNKIVGYTLSLNIVHERDGGYGAVHSQGGETV